MSNSASDRSTIPGTVWQARGRHTGTSSEDVLRRALRRHKDDGLLDDFAEPPAPEDTAERVFEARWRVDGRGTVRARLTLAPPRDGADGREWLLVAEAEGPWEDRWPSPATLFWPDTDDVAWDHHHAVDGLRLRAANPVPADDKAMRRAFRNAVRGSWSVHLVVHEAMTPDALGRLPLGRLLPPGLRHRVLEHRAAPHQLRAVNWALRDLGVEVPRGGAVLLPPQPAPDGYDGMEYAVRSVFLDGSEPTELIDALRRFTALPKPSPEGAAEALAGLRDHWTLLTLEEELARERGLVARYAEALEAMTRSRDLYRDAAEAAHEALAAYRDAPEPPADRPGPPEPPAASPLRQFTRTFARLKAGAKGLGTQDGTAVPDREEEEIPDDVPKSARPKTES
ncbi:hypothetical protein ABZ922_22465 [Streptomyces shenzhenensis]|uniref:hypothetical protein n=1 Tax=Streptomyces shenzhenensis TaxID=943815 RepID=UPI0033D248AB